MTSVIHSMNQLKDSGKPVIGCLPLYPPVELLHSMGLVPVILWGIQDAVPHVRDADKHIQNYACGVARRLTQLVIEKGAELFDGLFFYNACDTLRNLPEILQAGLDESSGKTLPLFRMHIPMTPVHQTDGSDYLKNEIQNLIHTLEHQYKVTFSEEKFAESVALYSQMKTLSKQLEDGLSKNQLAFYDFCQTLTEANLSAVEDQISLLQSRLNGLSHAAEKKDATGRILISGILPPPPPVCQMIDQAGLVISGNDIASFQRSYAPGPCKWRDVTDYYIQYYADHFPCTTLLHTSDRRMDTIINLTREKNADGFIFVGEKFCEYEYFEYPYLQNRLKDIDIPALAIEISMDDNENTEAIRTRIDAFAEVLSGRHQLVQHMNIKGR